MNRTRLDTIASLAMLTASAVMVGVSYTLLLRNDATDRVQGTRPETAEERPGPSLVGRTIPIRRASTIGSLTSRVGLIVYTDLECPFCKALVVRTLPEIRRTYVDGGKAFLALKHLPLAIHTSAFRLAEAVECAGQQGRLWEVHDQLTVLFDGNLEAAVAASIRRALLPDTTRFSDCWLDRQTADAVRRDIDEARRLGIAGTPMLLFGVRTNDRFRIAAARPGALPFPAVAAVLDHVIAKSGRSEQDQGDY